MVLVRGFFHSPVLVLTLIAGTLSATTPTVPASPACELLPYADIAAEARLIRWITDHRGRQVAHFGVEQSYKGLRPEVTFLLVLPREIDNCEKSFEPGRSYLLFAKVVADLNPNQVTTLVARLTKARQPIPLGLMPSRKLTVYTASACNGSRPIEESTYEIPYFHQRANRSPATLVTGRIENPDQLPQSGAKVRLQGNGRVFETKANPDGRYRFDRVFPGRYALIVEASGSPAHRTYVNVRATECTVHDVMLRSSGSTTAPSAPTAHTPPG